MASISGASSSNMTSSLYNSANVISGLASGLDTEGMIESLVQSYQTKINQLNQKVTKTEWKQDAYRSIISKMVGFSNKYTSYASTTNLLSSSFFNNAVKVETQGPYASLVTASGKTSSDIALNAVHQLATATQFRTVGNLKAGDGKSIQAGEGFDLNGKTTLGSLNGSLTLTYGSNNITLTFDEVADKESLDEIKSSYQEKNGRSMSESQALAELINQKLANQTITFSGGSAAAASERIEVRVDGMNITFKDKSSAGNAVYMSKSTGNVAKTLGVDLTNASEDKPSTIGLTYDFSTTRQEDNSTYLSEKTLNLSLDGGTAKQVKLPEIVTRNGKSMIWDTELNQAVDYTPDNYVKVLNDSLNKVFKNKVTVENALGEGADELQLRFNVQEGSNLLINTDVGETLGIGRAATSYLNTNKTLKDLLDADQFENLQPADKDDDGNDLYEFKINGTVIGYYSKESKLSDILNDINSNKEAGVKVSYSQTTKNFLFASTETGADSEIKISGGLAEAMFGTSEVSEESPDSFVNMYGISWLDEGETEKVTFHVGSYDLSFNVTQDDKIEDVAARLNETLKNDGWNASYNKYTGKLEVTDQNGAAVDLTMTDSYGDEVSFNEDYAPGVAYIAGQDAKFTVTINGEQMEMTRSSNTVNIDGLSITMDGEFDSSYNEDGTQNLENGEPVYKASKAVTFKSKTDSDKIIDAIRSMIEDYNVMMAEIKAAYSTMPYQNSSGDFANYEPLTDDDKAGMTESAIERYEEKAKQGILFGDRTLSTLYDKMRNIFSPNGEDGAYLRAMGITTSYTISDGSEAVTLDEDKLRAMLDSEPDIVADVFTRVGGENGGGVMQNLKTQLDAYAKTTGEPKGILIQQAGSPLSSLSLMDNTWQSQIDNLNTQIEKWQDKLSSQVDRYTQQFSRLEVLIQQMNSQSSTLAGLMGGY